MGLVNRRAPSGPSRARLFARRGGPVPADDRVRTASARRVDLADRQEVRRLAKLGQGWQEEAWVYRDNVPQLGYAMRFLAYAGSRLRLYPALATPDAEEPIPLDEAEGVPAGVLSAANDALARLSSDTFLWGDLLAPLMECLEVPGECYLVGYEDDTGSEVWEVRSQQALAFAADGVYLVDAPETGGRGTRGRRLSVGGPDGEDEDYLARIWTRHPQYPALADSPMRQLGGACETLLLADRAVRQAARNRLAGNGLLLVPSEIDLTYRDPETGQLVPDETGSRYQQDLQAMLLAPIEDDTAPSALVPGLMRGAGDRLAQVRHLTFDRPMDEKLAAAAEKAFRDLTQGVDLPPEVMTGTGDVNHWGAWQISDDTFRNHLQPKAIRAVGALTQGYLRAQLAAYPGVPPEWAARVVLWFDATLLTTRPNRTDDAIKAYDRDELAGDVLLQALGFDPKTDKPTDEEIERRLLLRQSRNNRNRNPSPAEVPPEPEPDRETPGPTVGEPESPAAVVAAAPPARERESRRLSDLDRSLRERLHVACEAALSRALERANNRVRSRAQNDATARAAMAAADFPAAASLGRAVVAALGYEDAELLRGAFAEVRASYDEWTERTQREALALAASIAGLDVDALPQAVVADLLARFGSAREAGWAYLELGLTREAEGRLYSTDPGVPEGELAPGELPFALVRGAVAVAGGLPADSPGVTLDGVRPDAGYVGGIGTGDLVSRFLRDAGSRVVGYEWVYGVSRVPFEPHKELDGVVVESLSDPRLAHDGWPAPILAPGDHKGCHCDLQVIWSDGTASSSEMEAVGDATYNPSVLEANRAVAAMDEAAGRYGYPSTTPIGVVAQAERVRAARTLAGRAPREIGSPPPTAPLRDYDVVSVPAHVAGMLQQYRSNPKIARSNWKEAGLSARYGPIEEAARQFDEAARTLRVPRAARPDWSVPNRELSAAEREVVHAYAWDGDSYRRMNGSLREGAVVDSRTRSQIEKLSDVIAGAPLPADVTLYRGAQYSPELTAALREAWDRPSKLFTDPGFVSSTRNRDVIEDFLSDEAEDAVVMTINARRGQPALVVGDALDAYADAYDQQEVILQRGQQFRVTSYRVRRGVLHVTLDVV